MSNILPHILDSPIEYLKGVGPTKGEVLKLEMNIFTFRDLLFSFPFRYVDKTHFHHIKDIKEDGQTVQLKGTLISLEVIGGKGRRSRLSALFRDGSGFIELVWFQGAKWIAKSLKEGEEYICYGKVNLFKGKKSIPHPELELVREAERKISSSFEPVYPSTEKMTKKGLDSKGRRKLMSHLMTKLSESDISENLPDYLLTKLKLSGRFDSLKWIHFPGNIDQKNAAVNRLKFEELFFLQLRLLQNKSFRKQKLKGATFSKIDNYFHRFFNEKIPFELTGAQKRVLKEIRKDLGSGIQMNRLLQGDVGSGKTIVGLMCMLMALDNGFQTCMMAPTEILAQQHYQSLNKMVSGLGIRIAFLSGTVKGKKRKELLSLLAQGEIHILVGTHALIEDPVIFQNLGLAIIDEQHRFGVKQRAKLWKKNEHLAPHILVMTATPIPRTLAMTVYGDLDVSIIDELPPGRKDIKTLHRSDAQRGKLIEFMRSEIKKGRQIYIVYPLIEESANLDLQNLNDGYEQLLHFFPTPDYQISVVHGRMKPADKDAEMQRFVTGKTQIMVATTVIEVGVNVPNASVMIIENTNRFGLSQLHQLRGRVGRGAEQSYCILMTDNKLSKDARERISTMVRTNNGFEIAEADLRLRGGGNIEGLQQSGAMDFRLVDIVQDSQILQTARYLAEEVLKNDPNLETPENTRLKNALFAYRKKTKDWGRIS